MNNTKQIIDNHAQQADLTLVLLILHERLQRQYNLQNMQLPTKEQLPAQR